MKISEDLRFNIFLPRLSRHHSVSGKRIEENGLNGFFRGAVIIVADLSKIRRGELRSRAPRMLGADTLRIAKITSPYNPPSKGE